MEKWRRELSSGAGTEDAAPKTHDIIAAVRRHQRWLQVRLAANLAFGALLLVGSILVARQAHSLEIILWAVAVWMSSLVAGFLVLEEWRKGRIPDTEAVAD